MRNVNRKESVNATRQAEESEITRILSAYGREVVERFFDMNVRTIVWANRSDGRVPVLIEQVRLYSSPGDWAFTRLMEASDLVDAARGLRKSLDAIRTWHLPLLRTLVRQAPDRDAILWAVRRGEKQPLKTFTDDSVATLVWGNPTIRNDMTFKVEQLKVLDPKAHHAWWHILHGFQLEDAIKGYEQARDFIVKTQRRLSAA